jgi:alkylation response protein AidB-like acyl-CoA dehydrogenase
VRKEAFRAEVRAFLQAELPDWAESGGAGNLGEGGDDRWLFLREFQRRLSRKGWLTLGWPREHGGQEAGVMMQVIYNEEMAYHRAPTQLGVGPDRVGPTIILYGRKSRRRGTCQASRTPRTWCQGSASGGSDLASLQTRADLDGDHW